MFAWPVGVRQTRSRALAALLLGRLLILLGRDGQLDVKRISSQLSQVRAPPLAPVRAHNHRVLFDTDHCATPRSWIWPPSFCAPAPPSRPRTMRAGGNSGSALPRTPLRAASRVRRPSPPCACGSGCSAASRIASSLLRDKAEHCSETRREIVTATAQLLSLYARTAHSALRRLRRRGRRLSTSKLP
jgi:hypothetical protein